MSKTTLLLAAVVVVVVVVVVGSKERNESRLANGPVEVLEYRMEGVRRVVLA